ncbi:MAG: HAD family hydrolase [Candidatus Dormibacteraceae bacterium]
MDSELQAGLVVWDVDGTLVPSDVRWVQRAIAATYQLPEDGVKFDPKRVHGYTDEPIVIETAINSGVPPEVAENGILRFHREIARVLAESHDELVRIITPYPGAAESIESLSLKGFIQTVLTGNIYSTAETKLKVAGLDRYLDLTIGAFGSDARDRSKLPAVLSRRFAERQGHPLDPQKTVVIGDSPNDIACARHAGFHVIAVAQRMERSELESHHPDMVIDRLEPGMVVKAVGSLIREISDRSLIS